MGDEVLVTQITARLSDEFVAALDGAASQLRRSRADVVRQAIEYYLDDFEDAASTKPAFWRARLSTSTAATVITAGWAKPSKA